MHFVFMNHVSAGGPLAIRVDAARFVDGVFITNSRATGVVGASGIVQNAAGFDIVGDGPGLRVGGLSIDANGIELNQARITQTAAGTIDFSFPMFMAPAGFAATGAAGGSVVGKHTYFVVACDTSACGRYSQQSQPVTVNLATPGSVALSWKPVPGAKWYTVIRDLAYIGKTAATPVPSYIDTGAMGCCWGNRPNVPAMVPTFRLTPEGGFFNGKQVF
jgi:hypothetical protein